MAIVRQGSDVAQVTFTPAGKYDISQKEFVALVTRAASGSCTFRRPTSSARSVGEVERVTPKASVTKPREWRTRSETS